MRVLALILVLIVSSQIALPCCIGMDHCDGTASHITHDHDHEPVKENHDCGNDCAGLCCGISFTLSNAELSISAAALSLDQYSFDYHFDYKFDLASSIWHPPTLS